MGDRLFFICKRKRRHNERYPNAWLELINRISVTRHVWELISSWLALLRMSFFSLTPLQIRSEAGEGRKQLHANLGLDCDLFGTLFVGTRCVIAPVSLEVILYCACKQNTDPESLAVVVSQFGDGLFK